jgi:flavodoxin I
MNTLVIYDSTFGNTQKIAQAISEVMAGPGAVRTLRVSKVQSSDLEEVDLLVLGCPTHKRKPTDGVRAFLECVSRKSLEGVSAAVFDTRYHKPRLLTGSAAGRLAKSLRKAGAALLASPQSFFVVSREGPLEEGETERAAAWAREILESFAAAKAG